MLLSSVIIVLREILEASLIISVLLVFSRLCNFSRRWIYLALGGGLTCAALYSATIGTVSQWFDYVGQEVLNASMQLAIFLFLLAMNLIILEGTLSRRTFHPTAIPLLMGLSVALAIAREGSEILIYHSGLLSNPELFLPVLMGGGLGAGIGISAGALLYYALISLAPPTARLVVLLLLALVSANMASQAVLLLIQADWLPSGSPVWNSSGWLPEESVLGQLLYALVGYEASPTGLQAAAYLSALTLLTMVVAVHWHFYKLQHRQAQTP